MRASTTWWRSSGLAEKTRAPVARDLDHGKSAALPGAGVDAGSTHRSKGEPHLDLDRLRVIASRIPQPIVLHGASYELMGKMEQAIRGAVAERIRMLGSAGRA